MQKSSKLILATALALFIFCGAGIATMFGVLAAQPDFRKMRSQVTILIKKRDKTKSTKQIGPRAPGWVPMKQVSNHLLMAVISSEDASFFSHNGVDMHELREALKKDIEEKRWARGASTITQQVVKNVFLTQEKTITRKIREILWAWQLDKALSKPEVLCFYVNMAEWGPGIYGIRDAAQHYFQKPASELSAKESAFLAMLLPSPWRYHSYFERKKLTPWAAGRVEQILRVMNRMGFLDDDEYAATRHENLWGMPDAEPATPGEPDAIVRQGEENSQLPPDEPSVEDPAPQTAPDPVRAQPTSEPQQAAEPRADAPPPTTEPEAAPTN